jgi:hypothetical protein
MEELQKYKPLFEKGGKDNKDGFASLNPSYTH